MRYQCSNCEFETDNVDDLREIEEREVGEWCDVGDATPAGQCPVSKKGDDPRFPLRCLAAVYDTQGESWRAMRVAEIVRDILWPGGDLEHEWSSDEIGEVADAMNLFGFRPKENEDGDKTPERDDPESSTGDDSAPEAKRSCTNNACVDHVGEECVEAWDDMRYRCPKCGNDTHTEAHSGRFKVNGAASFTVVRDGADFEGGDIEYDGDSHMECGDCTHSDTLGEFVVECPTVT